jgi:beta-galactosidase
MWYFNDYDYWQLKDVVDFVSWDSYPMWHKQEDERAVACKTAMYHDLMRTLKGKPFVLMESSGQTCWQPTSKLKSRECIFSRHCRPLPTVPTRCSISSGVKAVGRLKNSTARLSIMSVISIPVPDVKSRDWGNARGAQPAGGQKTQAKVAIIFDWENRWAVNDAAGPRNCGMHYEQTVVDHYRPFWEQGIAVDMINADSDLSGYELVIAPMLYMVRELCRAGGFVRAGGYFVATYWTGIVSEGDLCHLGGFPGHYVPLLGVWAEEIDSLTDEQSNGVERCRIAACKAVGAPANCAKSFIRKGLRCWRATAKTFTPVIRADPASRGPGKSVLYCLAQ